MYRQFVREMPETTDEKETWNWLKKANFRAETEAMLCKTVLEDCKKRHNNLSMAWIDYLWPMLKKTSSAELLQLRQSIPKIQ